ncbi:MAG: ATP-binding cassette domain-containing protein [Desulfobacterales bacterium]|nr:ATP-binding cassette domain-containing protein [Desulfobacterales bacterium]MDD4073574.1 ATP-binding cassette domain-containing protein [Desulfobacterales bacterium]MDD4393137.1 ATP-binding cassette domain-containing protein [Desulfobacterales bacterium]
MAISHNLLDVDQLSKTYSNGDACKTVLKDVSLSLPRHDSLAVVGPSGCGKSTLLLMISGLMPASGGTIRLDKTVCKGPSRDVGVVFQQYGLFPWKTTQDNILLGARIQDIDVPDTVFSELKQELGIEGLDHLYPNQLSGGQRQRVALARALLLNPRLLMLDEPFAALDAITREHLQNHLLSVFQHRGFSFILVTHNIEEAIFLGRRIVLMDPGIKGIHSIVDNPGMGEPDYREHPDFFHKVLEIRRLLKKN